MQLHTLIEKSYHLFEDYTIGKTLQVCTACCVTHEKVAELVNTSLRKISSKLMRSAYYESARNYTERELWEMKHFLPRVLELVTHFDFPCIASEIVFTRLDLDKAENWTSEELSLLREFSIAFFKKCLTFYPNSPNGEKIGTYVIMFGIGHFDMKPILQVWEEAEHIESLLHFKYFVLNEIEYKAQEPYKLTNAFSDNSIDREVINWMANKAVKNKFSTRIEKQIVENKHLDSKNAEELSWVYEMLIR